MPRLALLLLVLAACTPARRDDEDPSSTPDAGSPACQADADCGVHGSCDTGSGTCTCAPGFHGCGAQCLSDDAVASCGARCSPCPVPADGLGTATCVDRQCSVSCGEGRIFCGGSCIACAGSCVDGACRVDCASGTHRCGSSCVGDGEPSACGASCTACVPPAGSNLVASCVDGGCRFSCASSTSTCRGTCATGTCAWDRTDLPAFGLDSALAIDAGGNAWVAWTDDSHFGHVFEVGSGAQPITAGFCQPDGAIGLGFTARGPAMLCPNGNFQQPMVLHELVNGTSHDSQLSRAVTSAGALHVDRDVVTWVSDAHLYLGTVQNGIWSASDARVVSHDSIRGTSLLFDSAGRPQLAFSEMNWQTNTFHTVVLTRGANGAWTERSAGQDLPFGVKYVLLPDGTLGAAWVSWSQADNATLLYWAEEKRGFLSEIAARGVSDSSQADAFDVAVDATGAPRIAWMTSSGISFALRAGTSWIAEPVATGSFREVRLALTPAGSPVISGVSWGRSNPISIFR